MVLDGHRYLRKEKVKLFVNKLTSTHTQVRAALPAQDHSGKGLVLLPIWPSHL